MFEADHFAELWGLFFSAFVSSTIAPGGSEAVLAWLVSESDIPLSHLIVTATVGNTLGALTTWLLGLLSAKGYSLKWNRCQLMNQNELKRVRKWGVPILLFSWLPVVGDAFCFAAGWLKLPFLQSLIAITVGKYLRYSLVTYIFV